MLTVNVHEVKTKLSHYLDLVQKGKSVIIAKRNIPIAEIRPIEKDLPQRVIGQSVEKFEIPKEFFNPLPTKVTAAFNNPK